MKPIEPEDVAGQPAVFGRGQPGVEPLPARVTRDGLVYTRWQLSFDERRAILDGACIDLVIFRGRAPLQALSMSVQGV